MSNVNETRILNAIQEANDVLTENSLLEIIELSKELVMIGYDPCMILRMKKSRFYMMGGE